jgi:hypothetical protein
LAGINIKDHVRRVITLERTVGNLAGSERVDKAIGGWLDDIKKRNVFNWPDAPVPRETLRSILVPSMIAKAWAKGPFEWMTTGPLFCAIMDNDVNSTVAARIMDFMFQLPFSFERGNRHSDIGELSLDRVARLLSNSR